MLLPSWSGDNNSSAPDTVYRRVLERYGIEFNHVTHLRSSSIEQASTWGLDCFRLAIQSKHMVDKLHKFYMAESNRDVLSMMAGFLENETYFVPRLYVKIPFEHDKVYVTHIFPRYLHWVEEANSRRGDKNKLAAKNFLEKTLPYLAKVVIQDAPYHLEYYPNSEFSQFFRAQVVAKYPEYAEYCRSAIFKAEELAQARNEQQTRNLDRAAQ